MTLDTGFCLYVCCTIPCKASFSVGRSVAASSWITRAWKRAQLSVSNCENVTMLPSYHQVTPRPINWASTHCWLKSSRMSFSLRGSSSVCIANGNGKHTRWLFGVPPSYYFLKTCQCQPVCSGWVLVRLKMYQSCSKSLAHVMLLAGIRGDSIIKTVPASPVWTGRSCKTHSKLPSSCIKEITLS